MSGLQQLPCSGNYTVKHDIFVAIKFGRFAMKGSWQVFNLADFKSHGLVTSHNGYCHTKRGELSCCCFRLSGTVKCVTALL